MRPRYLGYSSKRFRKGIHAPYWFNVYGNVRFDNKLTYRAYTRGIVSQRLKFYGTHYNPCYKSDTGRFRVEKAYRVAK